MKLIYISAFMLICSRIYSQNNNLITIGYANNIDIWTPYTEGTKDFIKSGGKVESNSWSVYAQFRILQKDRLGLSVGLSDRIINHTAKDRLRKFIVYKENNEIKEMYVYKDPADLISKSNSLGANIELEYTLFANRFLSGRVGLFTEIYFFEYYRAVYYSLDHNDNSLVNAGIRPVAYSGNSPRMFLSSTNLSAFYRMSFHASAYFSVSGKVSIGTNLYSDWDQFKKYAWLGVGLELGFGKKKEKVKPE